MLRMFYLFVSLSVCTKLPGDFKISCGVFTDKVPYLTSRFRDFSPLDRFCTSAFAVGECYAFVLFNFASHASLVVEQEHF